MKLKSYPKHLLPFAAGTLLALGGFVAAQSHGDYVAHEWGTFTSVQGSDGVQLDWNSRQVAELPNFVYDWKKAGLVQGTFALTKSSLVTRQRMETPVIYFYADRPQTVDVSVRFPQGSITEWFPQMQRIGPAVPTMNTNTDPAHLAFDSRIEWSNVKILPAKENAAVAAAIPSDHSGSHYFAARETDSEFLQVSSLRKSAEHEKFLFYRGVGDFAVPLQVALKSKHELTLTNSGKESLSHLFVLQVRHGQGTLVHLDKLAPGENRGVGLDAEQPAPLTDVMGRIERDMARALESQGLFPREATAMVNTWKDSWFAEDGLRVLYLLPREWTDARLPLTLSPAPRDLVRVMVGRSEVLTPDIEKTLTSALTAAQQGNAGAREEAMAQLTKLGRFADPALRLANRHGSTNAAAYGFKLLAQQPESATQ